MSQRKNVVLIGTGAIADLVYLPVLTSNPTWKENLRCVDRDLEQLSTTCRKYGVLDAGTDYRAVLDDAVVAVIATPPRSHFPIAQDCLRAGVHAVLEKPLTDKHQEGLELVELARSLGRLVMVNNTRRLFQSYREVARIVKSGELGALREIDYAEGGAFAWPSASGFYFDPKQGGRGVLSDRGSHVLDLLCWWTDGALAVDSCETDVDGGVEGFCDVRMSFSGGSARMRLSWHNKLGNCVKLRFDRGEITTGIYDFKKLVVTRNGKEEVRSLAGEEKAYEDYGITFARQAIGAAYGTAEPPIRGEQVTASLGMIDECYAKAHPMKFPWLYRFNPAN